MSVTGQLPSPDRIEEQKFLDWVQENYGEDVRRECLRILDQHGGARKLSADVLEQALYRVNQADVDDARGLGETCFSSD